MREFVLDDRRAFIEQFKTYLEERISSARVLSLVKSSQMIMFRRYGSQCLG